MPARRLDNRKVRKPKIFGMKLNEDLEKRMDEVRKHLPLSKSAIGRLALDRGLTVLAGQYTKTP